MTAMSARPLMSVSLVPAPADRLSTVMTITAAPWIRATRPAAASMRRTPHRLFSPPSPHACDPDDGLIDNVRFIARTQLAWDSDPLASSYNIYRGSFQNGSRFNNAVCFAQTVGMPTVDMASPGANRGFYYLVTRVSSGIESTLGYDGHHNERQVSQNCP